MAVGGSDVIKDISENLLCCDVCQERFDSHSRAPRILSCFHTFCGVCLDQLVQNGKVKCPLCRQNTAVKGKIPMDPTRSTLLDKIRAMDSKVGVVCEACDDGVKSEYRCQDCQEFLCEECYNAHRRTKQTRNHTMVSLTEAAQDPSKFVKSIENCSRHPDLKLDMYCETCKQSVCTKCAFVLHKEGHRIVEVETVVEKKKKEVLRLCAELEQMVPAFQAQLDQSQTSLQHAKESIVEAENKIKTAISQIVNAAKRREAELLQKLRSRAKTDQLTHEEQVATFRSKLSAVGTTAGHGRRLVSMDLTTHLLEQAQHIEKMTMDLKKELTAPVETAPTYEVKTEMMFCMERMVDGYVELVDPNPIAREENPSSGASAQERSPVPLPAFTWDRDHCEMECSVTSDLCSLTNKPSLKYRTRKRGFEFPFRGAYGSNGLKDSCYWQVVFSITPRPSIEISIRMVDITVTTDAARQKGDTSGNTLSFGMDATYISVSIDGTETTRLEGPFRPHTPYVRTFGFLVDASAGKMTVIDVSSHRALRQVPVDTTQPLWLCAYFNHLHDILKAEVCLTIESGPRLATPSLVKLLRNVLAA